MRFSSVFKLRKWIALLCNSRMSVMLSDELFTKLRYYEKTGNILDLHNPVTFNEKLQWLKLYDRNPQYTKMVDKYLVKDYVACIVGNEYVIPSYGVWERVEDIDFDALPNQFVLKVTHDCGGIVICKDKSKLDWQKAMAKLKKSMARDYYTVSREWPYKDVEKRILAEKLEVDYGHDHLPVYKFFCFHGEPKIIQSIQNDKQPDESIDYFDPEWNLLDMRQNFPNSSNPLAKPRILSEMLEIARRLSAGHKFVRIDLYCVNEKIKFSEFTFYSDAGFAVFEPIDWDRKLGQWLQLDCCDNL